LTSKHTKVSFIDHQRVFINKIIAVGAYVGES